MKILNAVVVFVAMALPQAVLAQGRCAGTDMIDALPLEGRDNLNEVVSKVPFPEGLLWQATKGDTVIDIFGTYHFRHAQTDAHLERLKPLLDEADKIYLEISNADQLQMQRDMATQADLMFITEGPTLPDLLGDDDWQKYSVEMQARNIPGFMAAKFKPLWASMMLGIGPCEAKAGAFDESGIDKLIGDYAETIGNPSRSLEDYKELVALFDDIPMDQQLEWIRLTLSWPGDADDMHYTIRERYLAEQIALTWEYSRLVSLEYGGDNAEADFAMFSNLLLTKRNNDWIDVLSDEVEAGDRVVIAVGAGHLPGEIGLLYLLEKQGYAIERKNVSG